MVGDEFKHLAVQLGKKDSKKIDTKKIINLLKSINEQVNIFYELYYKYDKERLKELFELNKEFTKKTDNGDNEYKQDIQVTIESINRYINVLFELLIAKHVSNNFHV